TTIPSRVSVPCLSAWCAWGALPSVDSVHPRWSGEQRYHLPRRGAPFSVFHATRAWLPACAGPGWIGPSAAEDSPFHERSAGWLPETSVRARGSPEAAPSVRRSGLAVCSRSPELLGCRRREIRLSSQKCELSQPGPFCDLNKL